MRTAFTVTLTLSALLLAACGGGGSASTSAPGGSPGHTPAPATPQPAQGEPQTVHRVIGFSQHTMTESVPGSDAPALPPGFSDAGPIAHAVIVYPDGSTQTADGNGVYYPAKSAYALKYQTQLGRNASVQPVVVLTDPSGAAAPSTAAVSAYASAEVAVSRFVQARHSFARTLQAGGHLQNIAGVQLLPQMGALISGSLLSLNAVGVDTNNDVLDISQARVTWSAQYGSVYGFPNSSQAYYVPPSLSSGSLTDNVTVTVTLDGTTIFTASNVVTVVSPANAASVAGTLTAGGSPIPNGIALFAQSALPQAFAPDYWMAQADANGNYTALVPASSLFSLGMGAASGGNFDLYVASDANGNTAYRSQPAGVSDSLDLQLPSPPVPFSMVPPALSAYYLPSYVTFVRDAWFETNSFYRRVFEASSGIQPLLANPPSQLTSPTPANPAPLATGQLATWCYQWQPMNGAAVLVLIENTDAACSQPGNEAYTVNADPAGGFDYVHYLSTTPYQITGTPDVITGSLLVESGTWTQSVTLDGSGRIQSDMASVQSQLYDKANQVFGAPVYNESLQYQYSLDANGLSTAQFSNDQRTSAYDGSIVTTLNGTKTQVSPYGPGGCGSGMQVPCHDIAASVQQDGLDYTISGTQNADGSATYTYQNAGHGDATKITASLSSDVQSNSQGCMVCSSSPGTIYDTDGTTPIGTFTINDAGLVQTSIYDTQPGSATLGPDVIDTLGFLL